MQHREVIPLRVPKGRAKHILGGSVNFNRLILSSIKERNHDKSGSSKLVSYKR